ncbi:MAG: hypothetical protein GX049_10230 [Alcaligenaceae bacterium]|nr:hypothetical protein [Alcaligenaceae bacterium]
MRTTSHFSVQSVQARLCPGVRVPAVLVVTGRPGQAAELLFKVKGSPAVLSTAVRGRPQG